MISLSVAWIIVTMIKTRKDFPKNIASHEIEFSCPVLVFFITGILDIIMVVGALAAIFN